MRIQIEVLGHSLVRLLVCSHRSLQRLGTVNDWMAILTLFSSILAHSVLDYWTTTHSGGCVIRHLLAVDWWVGLRKATIPCCCCCCWSDRIGFARRRRGAGQDDEDDDDDVVAAVVVA